MENGKARLGAYYLAVESMVASCDKTRTGGALGGHHLQKHRGLLMHTRTWEVRSSTWSVRQAWAVVARQAALRMSPAGQPLVPHPTHLEGYIVQGLKSFKEARQVLVGRLGSSCESELTA
jgi:hypothetical protein